ncbi:imidazole glycerol phosphate synthase subunit HisH [Geobacter sp. DSM 9736]|uniref:imidazole glycerol phosphate synthase subunit HisH n=1 Tax=Geobacter sp. DSM 9736 TaxID=1277350 RepID=UPI000B50563D|nr:imidazole glycerol phosphate synthase subunit HisH [Geobacter sp. DSM 9736]SNB45055.1 glutamine amidotransferase [Geobacter sp. DSM 9736]
MITIIDYGMGNLGSIRNMLKKIGAESRISGDPSVVAESDKLILPGVGSFDAGIRNLSNSGLMQVLSERVTERKVPVLGICLGMQLMTRKSEEGTLPGLGWVDAETVRFSPPAGSTLKVPHMGWNTVTAAKESPLFSGAEPEERFYFVHSYYVRCLNREDVLLTAEHGQEFDAGFCCGNVAGVQFHPEKSHKFGMRFLRNFVEVF